MDRMKDCQSAVVPASGGIRLGQVAAWLSVMDMACNRCRRRGRLNTARLVAKYGTEMPISELLRIAAEECPRTRQAHDMCGVHLPQLRGLRL
jgi:hypothetical protein